MGKPKTQDYKPVWKLLSKANCTPKLSGNALKVLFRLLEHRNTSTGQCNPSIERLASDIFSHLAPSTGYEKVKKALRELRETGIIKSVRTFHSKSHYSFVWDYGADIDTSLGDSPETVLSFEEKTRDSPETALSDSPVSKQDSPETALSDSPKTGRLTIETTIEDKLSKRRVTASPSPSPAQQATGPHSDFNDEDDYWSRRMREPNFKPVKRKNEVDPHEIKKVDPHLHKTNVPTHIQDWFNGRNKPH